MSCREKCPHSKACAEIWPRFNGDNTTVFTECPMYDKIEDWIMEAEPTRRYGEDIPFCDDGYDGPEVED